MYTNFKMILYKVLSNSQFWWFFFQNSSTKTCLHTTHKCYQKRVLIIQVIFWSPLDQWLLNIWRFKTSTFLLIMTFYECKSFMCEKKIQMQVFLFFLYWSTIIELVVFNQIIHIEEKKKKRGGGWLCSGTLVYINIISKNCPYMNMYLQLSFRIPYYFLQLLCKCMGRSLNVPIENL